MSAPVIHNTKNKKCVSNTDAGYRSLYPAIILSIAGPTYPRLQASLKLN